MGSSANTISGRLQQRAADGDALLLTTGELGRPVVEPVPEPDRARRSVSSHAGSGFLPASDIGSVMFSSALSVGIEVVGLEDEADAGRAG